MNSHPSENLSANAPVPGAGLDSLEAAVWDTLHHVIDPELGVNLVDLGLIYSVIIDAGRVRVVMTVTTPGCPMEHSLTFGVETAVLAVEGVTGVEVAVVHDPPWNPSMMTPEGRAMAGIVG